MHEVRAYGSWKSPITAEVLVADTIGLGEFRLDGNDLYWAEGRPQEKGRVVIVRRDADGKTEDITPAPFNARTRVHEYGGGSFCVAEGVVYFSNFADQRIYKVKAGEQPEAITAEGAQRYADGVIDPERGRLICVQEDHSASDREAVNRIVSLPLEDEGAPHILAEGHDFYSSPRLSPDGKRLLWLCWDHPNMPWDGTELWMGELDEGGSVLNSQKLAGGREESIFQPEWSPDGIVTFTSDRNGWWNFYRWQDGETHAVLEMEAEFGRPQWVFGISNYGYLSKDTIVCGYTHDGDWHLGTLNMQTGQLERIESPYTYIREVRTDGKRVLIVASTPVESEKLLELDPNTGQFKALRSSSRLEIEQGYLSQPKAIQFPTTGGKQAHALYYPPTNQDYRGPAGTKPPLIVFSHGGPTSQSPNLLKLRLQYWTSRGFAAVDVNYGGSTGYGRPYRQRLNGQWGVVDMDDCANAARYLVAQGEVDSERLTIQGGSAGGYTTLCALTFLDEFKAGASYFGVGDLEALAIETHKFESRYLDSMVGPYPQEIELYHQRSPIHHVEQLNCPVIFLQGLEDKVVPPNQAETMVEALKEKGIPVAYVAFEGEGHGFRQGENIKRSLEAELYFYGQVFGFEPADEIEPIEIYNLEKM